MLYTCDCMTSRKITQIGNSLGFIIDSKCSTVNRLTKSSVIEFDYDDAVGTITLYLRGRPEQNKLMSKLQIPLHLNASLAERVVSFVKANPGARMSTMAFIYGKAYSQKRLEFDAIKDYLLRNRFLVIDTYGCMKWYDNPADAPATINYPKLTQEKKDESKRSMDEAQKKLFDDEASEILNGIEIIDDIPKVDEKKEKKVDLT
jgi:hypothetical protein